MEYKIDEEYDFSGEWFLPENANKKISGNLKWSERATLKLNDSFEDLVSGPIISVESERYSVIHGHVSTGHNVSLLDLLRASSSFNFGSAGIRRPVSFVSSFLIHGVHVFRDTLYRAFRFEVPGLEVWLNQEWVNATRVNDSFIDIELRSPNKVRVSLASNDCDIEISIAPMLGRPSDGAIRANAIASVVIKSESGRDIDWYLDKFGSLTGLFSVIGGTSFSARRIQAKIENLGPFFDVLVALRKSDQCDFSTGNDFYMLATQTGVELSSLVVRWFEVYSQIKMPINLALSVFSSKDLWLHMEFLTLMQCLEGFHRAVYKGNYMNPDDYEVVQEKIFAAIPINVGSDHRASLKSRIRYGNEISLARRLSDLSKRLDASLAEKILGVSGGVPRRWVDTRNYYTHWDESSRELILSNNEIVGVNLRLKHFLRALYLDFLGIPAGNIIKCLIGSHKDSQWLLQMNSMGSRGGT